MPCVATKVGVERTTVFRWESSETIPTPWSRPGLETLLGISNNQLTRLLGQPGTDTDISPTRLGLSHEALRPVAPPVTSAPVGTVDPVKANQERGFRPPHRSDDPAPVPAALVTAAALVGDGDGDAFDRLAAAVAHPRRVDAAVIEHLAAALTQQRQLEDVIGAHRMLPAVLAEVELIERLAQDARGPIRAGLVGLAGEYRQFAGWMDEDTGDHVAALAHYDRAMDAAQETGDANLVTSVLSLKSHLAWSEQDVARAVGLAVAGQRDTARISPGVLALIVQQERAGTPWTVTGTPWTGCWTAPRN